MLMVLLFLSQGLLYDPHSKLHRSLKAGPKFVFVNDVEKVWAKQLLKKNHKDWSEAR